MKIPQSARVLEIGTGTGAIAASAASYTTGVVATDVNPYAIKCAEATMRLNDVEDSVEVIQGDLFAPVQGHRFDVILFNPPYLMGSPRTLLARAWYAGPNCELLTRFLTEAQSHLAKGGTIQVLLSSIAPLREIISMIHHSGFQLEVLARGRLLGFLETLYLLRLS
jgi:release factor glutamine methyltransferase